MYKAAAGVDNLPEGVDNLPGLFAKLYFCEVFRSSDAGSAPGSPAAARSPAALARRSARRYYTLL